ncbi:hypothetical protein [Azospirillum doebereinerae]
MTSALDLLNTGVAHHNAGRLAEAEGLYRRVLAIDSQQYDALHLLGLIASAVGRLAVAERLIQLAISLHPDFVDAFYNLGNIRQRDNRLEAALSAFGHAVALAPTPRNRDAAGRAHAERAAELAGAPLSTAFNAVHRRNRAEPLWRTDALLTAWGAERRSAILAHVDEALRLSPDQDMVRHAAMLIFVAIGALERGLAVLGSPDGDGNAEFGRLGAELAWYLRRPDEARACYRAFIRRQSGGEAPLRPLLPEVARRLDGTRPRGTRPRGPVLLYAHYGNPDFLHYSIGQSLISNPDARVILIGDRENRIEGIEHHRIQDFNDAARPVIDRYRHDSNNPYCYELFCIARWFLFLDLCRREGIEEMFVLDSDYMLFTGLSDVADRCRPLGCGFSLNSAHFSYFRTDTLAAFCDHIAGIFRRGEEGGDFCHKNNSELLSDMAFLFDFQRRTPHRNFCVIEEGGRFDYSITAPEGYRSTKGVKDIRFENGLPYALPEDGGAPTRFFGLHFQGLTKPMMRRAFHRQSWGDAAATASAAMGEP